MNIKTLYRGRHLPHILPIGATYFVTFRLEGSIPKKQLIKLARKHKKERHQALKENVNKSLLNDLDIQQFNEYDQLLDRIKDGPMDLKDVSVANIVAEQIHRFDTQFYDLLAFCIMSNHVHLLIDTSTQLINGKVPSHYASLDKIMQRIKGASARYCNLKLGKTGRFWALESYDHYVRNNRSLNNILSYILDNPVKAGLIYDWKKWAFTYVKTSPRQLYPNSLTENGGTIPSTEIDIDNNQLQE